MGKKRVLKKSAPSRKRSSTELGNIFEAQAVDELRSLGWTILDRQYKTPYGEIDIIAAKDLSVWFVEVKGTSSSTISAQRVSSHKQKKIILSIEHWLMETDISFEEMEIVLCLRTAAGMHWIMNAFDADEK